MLGISTQLPPVSGRNQRDACVKKERANWKLKWEPSRATGQRKVHLKLSDGAGEIADLRLLCGSPEQAGKIEDNFRYAAEIYYNRIMEMLLTDERNI